MKYKTNPLQLWKGFVLFLERFKTNPLSPVRESSERRDSLYIHIYEYHE